MHPALRPRSAFVRLALLLFVVLSLTTLHPTPARAVTITVTTPGDENNTNPAACSLREAIQAATTDTGVGGCPAGAGPDIITFAPGLTGPITLSSTLGPLVVGAGVLTIDGPGAGSLTVSGGSAVQLLQVGVTAQLTLEGLTLANGRAHDGGAILSEGDLSVVSAAFTGNTADSVGGAIHHQGGSLTIADSTFTGNQSIGAGAGAIFNEFNAAGRFTITGSTFGDNVAGGSGGAIYNVGAGTFKITRSAFNTNQADEDGGAIFSVGSGTLAITRGTFDANRSVLDGGAIFNGSGYRATVADSTFSDNHADDGGAIRNERSTLTLTRSAFLENAAVTNGGAIYTIGSLTIDSSSFRGNQAGQNSGAVHNIDMLAVTTSAFNGNSAPFAGAIVNFGTLTVSASTFSGNTSTLDSGAIKTGGTLNVTNSTFSGNDSVRGGAIFALRGVSTVISSTFGGNLSDTGVLLREGGAVFSLRNVVFDNPAPSCSGGGTFTDQGGNIAIDTSCAFTDLSSHNDIDPRLGPLADNGGPTQTMTLQPGSPAIQAAVNCPPPDTDQRGAPRTDPCDSGAVEAGVAVPPTLTGIDPTSGPAGGDTPVTIRGTGFADGTTVTFGGQPATAVTVLSATEIQARTPAHTPGAVDVTVTNPDGQSATLDDAFTYTQAAPTVTSITPTYGPGSGGTVVEIQGSGFRPGQGTTRFGYIDPDTGVFADLFEQVSCRDAMTCTARSLPYDPFRPPFTVATVLIFALVDGQMSAAGPGFSWYDPPQLDSLTPGRGPASGGTTVTLTGGYFRAPPGGAVTVTFGGRDATGVSCTADFLVCAATAPAGSGTVEVVLTAVGGASNALSYTYVAPPVAESDSVATQQGRPAVIDVLANATGEGIVVSAVGDPANGTAVINPNGTITYTPDAGFVGTDTFPFTISDVFGQTHSATVTVLVQALAPLLSGLSPTAGPAGGGTSVSLTGEFLANTSGPTTVMFGSTLVTNVQCNATADRCTALSPAGSGPVQVTVQTSGGMSNGLTFTYVAAPVATNDSATTPFQTPVTVNVLANDTGDGIRVTAVGAPAHGTAVINVDSTITYTPATGFSGTDSFTYTIKDEVNQEATATVTVAVAAAPPTLGGITPAEGPTEGGTRVTIRGTGFQRGITVRFDGLPAGNVSFVSATEIQATTPAHAVGPVAVSVQNPDGQRVSVPASFTYLELIPTVSSVSPARGPEAGGTPVSLTGTGFRPGETSVSFGGVPATGVDCQSTTACTAVSPPGRGTVNVRVMVGSRTSPETPAAGFAYEPPPRPMTLSVQVWRQLPPLVSEGQTEGTIVPVVGGVVEALVGGIVCGQGVTDGQGRASLVVVADPPNHGCGQDGAGVSFRVNGAAAAGDPLRFQSGGQAAVTLLLPGPMPPPRR